MKFFFVMSAIGSMLGALLIMVGLFGSKGAPQEAAAGALACAFSVVPYVFARAIQLVHELDASERRHRELVDAIKTSSATPK